MAAPNVGELVASTWWKQGPGVADNISDNNMLLKRLKAKGRRMMVDGGREIRETLAYGDNGTFGWYQGYQPLAVAPVQSIDVANYSPKQASVAITISGRERLMNRSDAELVDLLDTRMGNAEKSMANQMSIGVYSDGTGYGGNQLVGLKNLVPVDETAGTSGGISRASFEWWRGQGEATTATAATVEGLFNKFYAALCRGTDKPDLIVVDNLMWAIWVNVLQGKQRFVSSSDKATAGFPATKYMGADVVLDGGQGGRVPATTAIFLNTDYLKLKTYSGANMEPAAGGARYPVDQDAEVHHILWMGALCMSNGALQGRLGQN